MEKVAVVTGSSGFIGHHLVRRLLETGDYSCVFGLDIKEPKFPPFPVDEDRFHFLKVDLRNWEKVSDVVDHIVDSFMKPCEVFALAADMGGMGFISKNHRIILTNNLNINLNTAEMARLIGAEKVFFSSSACVYPGYRQCTDKPVELSEDMAMPADPQDAYGWEKLTAEFLYTYYKTDGIFSVRIARFHNIFGPETNLDPQREKAPAALCKKAAIAKLTGNSTVEIWGDGKQIRSFLFVDDCIDGILRLMKSDYTEPLNIGSDRAVSIDELALMIADIADLEVIRLHHVEGPVGVRSRNSDNTLIQEVLGWKPPEDTLERGLRILYPWVEGVIRGRLHL